VIVLRIASIGIWIERLHGNKPSPRMLISSIIAAAVCAVIVLLKVLVGH